MNSDQFFTKWYNYFTQFASSKLSKYAKRYVAPTDPEVLDYVHDAYMKACTTKKQELQTAFNRFEGTEIKKRAWFCVLIDNCMKDKFKSAANRLELYTDTSRLDIPFTRNISKRNTDIIEMLKMIKPHLTDSLYKVLLLRSISLSHKEISEVLGIPLGTTASRIHTIKLKGNSMRLLSDIL